MNISLTENKQYAPDDVVRIASDLMKHPVRDARPIGQGANSRVFRLSSSDGDYVMKFYFQHPKDHRDRLGTEFRSLSFLWEQGIRQVPQPLNAWPQQSCALYTMVKGEAFTGQIADADIDKAADFLKTLKSFTNSVAGKEFIPASEAFFSAKDIMNSLRVRLKRFQLTDNGHEYTSLRQYIQEDYLPLLETVESWSKEHLTRNGGSWDEQLLEQYRTLSSSDFGFHNALRNSTGQIVFLDFEYFGWDDPVKTVSDFLWHPAMNLTEKLKQRFVNRAQIIFGDDPGFQHRLKAFFPVFGLKWCLIILNEFVAVDMQRRGFAQETIKDKTTLRLNQLAKAKALSDHVRQVYRDFPYGN